MGGIGLLIAFLGGIVSFASPCCLPLVPAYVGYIVGTDPAGGPSARRTAFVQSLAFVAGFSIVFVGLWASIGAIGYLLRDQAPLLRSLGGAVIVFMGLHVAGLIDVGAFARETRLPVGRLSGAAVPALGGSGGGTFALGAPAAASPSLLRSGLLGVVFAAGWTPCIGPILGGILGLATVSSSVVEGTVLLVAYAAGLAVPFVLVALGATAVSRRLGWLRDHHRAVSLATGSLLVVVGLLMITNTFARLSGVLTPLG
jgi:cytochrome c-type biogenesis protein